MQKSELKDLLKEIKNDEYKIPEGIEPYKLSLIMLNNIGDTDSELRDDLILYNLFKWINSPVLSNEEVYKLFRIAMDEEHLMKGLGGFDDSVFSRTFSAEVVASAIYRHRGEKFIEKNELLDAFYRFLEFYDGDKDVRGFVEGKGWAHGAAHGADALDEFARCDELGTKELEAILNSIYKKIAISHYGYIHFEDERIITVVKAILERNLVGFKKIEDWVKEFSGVKKESHRPEDLVEEFNVNVFLKSLYFRLIDSPEYALIANIIKDTLAEISRFSQY